MTQTVTENTIVFWQTEEKNGQPEPAVTIEPYTETIVLCQGNEVIRLNYDSLDEFIKQLRAAKKLRP